jgi:hypothetical protein
MTMNGIVASSLAFLVLLALSSSSHAAQADVLTGQGVGYALVVVEKCTGVSHRPEYFQAIYVGMTKNGVSGDDFKQGYTAGAVQAELRFPGKPPTKECREANSMKVLLEKSLKL